MFATKRHDIFTLPQRFTRLIPINRVGVMGAGLALQFRTRMQACGCWPNIDAKYQDCVIDDVWSEHPGYSLDHTCPHDNHHYLLVATKRHWRDKSRKEDILAILDNLARGRSDERIATPLLGAGLGGLDPTWVEQQIFMTFAGHPYVHVLLVRPPA